MQNRISRLAALAALVLAAACHDTPGGDTPLAPPGASGPPARPGAAVAAFECTVAVDEAATTCRDAAPSGSGSGASLALLGLNQIKMASSGNSYDSITEIYGFDATMQNLLTYAIGTPDGQTRAGSRVYFESGPTASSFATVGDTGTVRVRNADGYADYTAGDQPYFFYDTILQPQQVSVRKRWEFDMPREVKSFKFSVKIFTETPVEYRVTLTPPDTIPAGFYDSANVLMDSPHFGLSRRTLKGIVGIRFNATATRDERQAAVDVIRGRVVGGRRVAGTDGYYFVRITDDGTGRQMRTAVDTLSKIPSVATAQPEYLWLPEEFSAYVEPDEGGGDWRAPWRVNPSAANGENWALEAVAAPQAWGCTTGSPLVKVGVVDGGYFSNNDLMVNTSYAPALDAYSAIGYADDYHGTSVASLIGARGNNGQGITGMMWNADLRLYDYSVHDDGERATVPYKLLWRTPVPVKELVERRLLQAINDGAHVINLSIAVPRSQSQAIPEADRRREVERMAEDLAALVRSASNKPLLVIGAGNNNQDAYWAVIPVLARLLPDQAIVVAGTESVADDAAPLWIGSNGEGSNHNTADIGQALVQISAPAQDVGVLTPSGHTTKTGTSMSAPIVAGIAGLLKSFDSRLTAGEIKQLLIEGSVRGRRRTVTDGTVYLANAYQSLVAAAERAGAPLCGGMPVWRDEELGLVQGRRIVGSTVGSLESLFLQGGSDLVPMHGETTIRVDQNYYGWFDGTWQRYPVSRADLFGNATNRSKLGQSHDGDSTVTVSRVEVSETAETYNVYINGQLLAAVPSTWAKKPAATQCVYYHQSDPGCYSQVLTWYDRITTHPAVGYSPRGDEVVLALWKQKSTYYVETPYLCSATNYCRDHGIDVSTLASELIFIRISDGQITERRAGPIRAIKQIGYSEDGQRLVMATEFTFRSDAHITSTGETTSASTWYCQAQYTTRSGTTLATLPLKRQVPHCYGTATFSP